MTFSRRQVLQAAAFAPFCRVLDAAAIDRSRLGVTSDEIHDDLEVAAAFLKSFRLGYAEIRNLWGKYNTEHSPDEIRRARSILDKHGLKTNVLDTGFFKVPLPAAGAAGQAALDKQWALLERAFERARIFGTDVVRIFAFTREKGSAAASLPAYGAELLAEAARRARAAKMRLAVENLAGSYVGTAAESAKMFQAVREAELGLAWDPNNAAAEGEKSFPDGYRKLDVSRIYHVHLRDYRHNSEGKVEWCAVGEGEFDNLGQLRALAKAGYKGGLSLETHYKHPLGKEHATRTSLTGLLKVIDRL